MVMIWKVLEIDKTKDEEAIKSAYREKLRYVNPEDDAEGFKELRKAYEEAMNYANEMENESLHNTEDESTFVGNKNEVDLWIDQVDKVYQDAATRRDVKVWKNLLLDDICNDLDTEIEAGEKLLVYFMSHSFMPQAIWQLVDEKFGYRENFDQLKERFPENFLEYVVWQIEHQGFIDYDMFEGKTDDRVDEYISTLYDTKAAFDDENTERLTEFITKLSNFELIHPFTKVEEARYLLTRKDKDDKAVKEALEIMEELDFEYSDNPYIERVYAEILIEDGQVEKAKEVYDALVEKDNQNYSALLGKARCKFLLGDPEQAKEDVEDILEERVQDHDSMTLLDEINLVLVKKYTEQLEEIFDRDITFKLGWCYYQQKEFEKAIAMLDDMEQREDYDFVNLRCRLYLAAEQYENAYPWARKWLQLIEETVDDGSHEMKKRKNRISLALFSLGICAWEVDFKNASSDQQEEEFQKAEEYILKSIEEERNEMVKFSYKEQLARFCNVAKHYEKCIEVCNDVIAKDRGFFPAYVHRQEANFHLKNAREVIDDYFACREIYPAYAKPYIYAAEVFLAFDQYDDVESVIAAAKECGIESDSLTLFEIKCLHYKEDIKANIEKALCQIEELKERVTKEDCATDLESLEELEREHAIILWDLDKMPVSLMVVEAYLEEHPDVVSMLQLKIDILNRQERYEEGLEITKKLITDYPDVAMYYGRMGNQYERLKQYDDAMNAYRKSLEIDAEYVPGVRRLMYLYSYLSNREGNLQLCKEGIDYATRLIELTGSAEGYIERGNLYIDLYELEKAVEDCKKAIELDPEAYYAYNNLGCALLKLRKTKEAIEPLEKVIAMDPDRDHLPYLNLAECYTLEEEYGKAVQMYREVLRLRPQATHFFRDIAKVYIKAKQYDKAIKMYEQMMMNVRQEEGTGKERFLNKLKKSVSTKLTEEERDIQRIYCDIADVYCQMGNTVKAEEYYKYVDPRRSRKQISTKAASDFAEYYRDKGEPEKALEVLNQVKDDIPEIEEGSIHAEHLAFIYATIYFDMGNKEKATAYADQYLKVFLKRHGGIDAIMSDPRYSDMHMYVVVIMHICAGRLEEAKKCLDMMKPCLVCVTCEAWECYEFYFAHGLIAELEGRKEEAVALYEKAIKLRGDYPCATNHLQMVKKNM